MRACVYTTFPNWRCWLAKNSLELSRSWNHEGFDCYRIRSERTMGSTEPGPMPTNKVLPHDGERARFATRVIHAGQVPDPSTGAVMPPIYTTSTYKQHSPGVHKGLDYGRSHNPTRWAFERCVADLEDGNVGFAFSSGLAAIATVLELLDS